MRSCRSTPWLRALSPTSDLAGEPARSEERRGLQCDPDLAADVVDVADVADVADVVAVAAAETGKTAEAEVGVGEMVQPQTSPTKTDRNLWAAVRTERKEIGRRRRDDRVMWMGSSVRRAVRYPQEKLGSAIGRPQSGQ